MPNAANRDRQTAQVRRTGVNGTFCKWLMGILENTNTARFVSREARKAVVLKKTRVGGMAMGYGTSCYHSLVRKPLTNLRALELNGTITANPRFRDPGKGDFRLEADRPAIDAGRVIPGVNDSRFHGKAPDVGAFEMKPTP